MSYSFFLGAKVDPAGGLAVNVQTDAAGASESTRQRQLLESILLELQTYNANFANTGLIQGAGSEPQTVTSS